MWKTIDTAPKDTVVDIWVVWPAYGDKPESAKRAADAIFHTHANDWKIGQYYLSQYSAKPYATHWMEPPLAP